MNVIKDYWWLITMILGAIGYVVAVAIKGHDLVKRLEKVESQQQKEREDISILLQGQFATLDGLKQLKCNGRVSNMHEKMEQYVLSKH